MELVAAQWSELPEEFPPHLTFLLQLSMLEFYAIELLLYVYIVHVCVSCLYSVCSSAEEWLVRALEFKPIIKRLIPGYAFSYSTYTADKFADICFPVVLMLCLHFSTCCKLIFRFQKPSLYTNQFIDTDLYSMQVLGRCTDVHAI